MIAIQCLGFQIRTAHSVDTWQGYKELRQAEKFAGLFADQLREFLAFRGFLIALERRDRLKEVRP